jgi:hypothetical protein
MNQNKHQLVKRLTRHKEEQKLYVQLGNKYNIPHDIMRIIFNINEKCIINYHKNIITYTCLRYDDWPRWRGIYYDVDEQQETFKHRIPDNKGIEWVIGSYFDSGRDDTHLLIKVLGAENYLYKYSEDGISLVPADMKLKLRYFKVSSVEEIELDYNTYRAWDNTESEEQDDDNINLSPYQLIIEADGDARYS